MAESRLDRLFRLIKNEVYKNVYIPKKLRDKIEIKFDKDGNVYIARKK